MSAQSSPTLVSETIPSNEIPQLTDAYRKAHKSYVLVSGLLAAWELIGISVQTKEKWGIATASQPSVPLRKLRITSG